MQQYRFRRMGRYVTVTPEMQGAGVVASGVTLPPIPKLAGDHSKPVPASTTGDC
jgi:hypothetical protein